MITGPRQTPGPGLASRINKHTYTVAKFTAAQRMHQLPSMAGGAWGSTDPPGVSQVGVFVPGTPTRTVRHLHLGRWLCASEGFAMTNRTAVHPRLFALIGDIAARVPEDLAREIECALNEQNLPAQSATFFTCLNAINHADGDDGQPCNSLTLGASNHASLRRSLS